MSKLPKLRVMTAFETWDPAEETISLEEAKYRIDFDTFTLVAIEDQVVRSYDELVQLASQDCYKGKEFLNVVLIYDLVDGG